MRHFEFRPARIRDAKRKTVKSETISRLFPISKYSGYTMRLAPE
jgi:hypothetical protein